MPFDHAELSVVDGTSVTLLTTDPARYVPEYVGIGTVTVLSGADGTFVQLDDVTRGGAGSYLWSLDDPCTSLVPATPPPTTPTPSAPAAPAQPISTEATFTG